MIEVSVTPRRLVAGRRAQLEIRLTNTGGGLCTDIVFTLGLPSGFALVSGRERVEIGVIRPGMVYRHTLTVEPARAGDYALTSPNFSYRDEDDARIRVSEWRAPLSVQAPAPEPRASLRPAPRPAPRLRVEHDGGTLARKEWGVLNVLVRNATGVSVSDVWVTISGPLESNGKRGRIPVLLDGQTARVPFSVKAGARGLVPVTVRLTYSFPDGVGSQRGGSQEDQLNVMVARREETAAQNTAQAAGSPGGTDRVQTVLFLAASPKDMEPLSPDEELRKIEQELQLDPNRNDFSLKSHVAVRLTDISRALVRYKPHVVHFSGHGAADGRLYVQDESGFSKPVNPQGLAEMFGECKDTIRCVVVNACHSEQLAEAMSRHIDYVVGMHSEVGDSAAILFSVGFYQALFGGKTVPEAFRLARSLLWSDEATETAHEIPVLYPLGCV